MKTNVQHAPNPDATYPNYIEMAAINWRLSGEAIKVTYFLIL